MAQNAPGKAHRKGISLKQLFRMFPDDDAARRWFESKIWRDGPYCPHCGSFNVQVGIRHKTMTHRCRDCDGRPMFSLKTGNIMEGSKLGYQTWAIAIYLVTTNLKGVSSLKLHRDLEVSQKSAWHLAHRLRKAFETDPPIFAGPAEADEFYAGGKESNKHASKKLHAGRGAVGKVPVAGIRDRATGHVAAQVVPDTRKETLQDFAHVLKESDLPRQQALGERIKAALTETQSFRVVNNVYREEGPPGLPCRPAAEDSADQELPQTTGALALFVIAILQEVRYMVEDFLMC